MRRCGGQRGTQAVDGVEAGTEVQVRAQGCNCRQPTPRRRSLGSRVSEDGVLPGARWASSVCLPEPGHGGSASCRAAELAGPWGTTVCESGLVGLRVMHIARTRFDVAAAEGVADDILECSDQLQERRPGADGQFTGSGSATRRRMASASTATTVPTKVKSRSGAVPVDRQRFPGEGPRDEGRHHGRVGMSGRLQRTEDVEESESQHRKPERAAVGEGYASVASLLAA